MEQFEKTASDADIDKVSAEYSYDAERYRKMYFRSSWGAVILSHIVFVAILLSIGVTVTIILDQNIYVRVVFAVVYGAVVLATVFLRVNALRKQLQKTFEMYCEDGKVTERMEIAGNALFVQNLCNQNSSLFERRNIVKVKRYSDFFVVTTASANRYFVPFNGETERLYLALTDSALFERAGCAYSRPNVPCERTEGVQSFDYTLTRKQATDMMAKISLLCVRGMLITSPFYLAVGVLFFVFAVTGDEPLSFFALGGLMCFLTALFVLYSVYVCEKSKKNGKGYFDENSLDGAMQIRIELTQRGIVAVNVLHNTRTEFRLRDMVRVKRVKGYFFLQFASAQILPVPYTSETAKLFEILQNALPKPLATKL